MQDVLPAVRRAMVGMRAVEAAIQGLEDRAVVAGLHARTVALRHDGGVEAALDAQRGTGTAQRRGQALGTQAETLAGAMFDVRCSRLRRGTTELRTSNIERRTSNVELVLRGPGLARVSRGAGLGVGPCAPAGSRAGGGAHCRGLRRSQARRAGCWGARGNGGCHGR